AVPCDRDLFAALDKVEQVAKLVFCLECANDFHGFKLAQASLRSRDIVGCDPPPPAPTVSARLLARRKRDPAGQVREGVLLVGKRHRGDEMALEVRLDRGLDLVDAPDDALD